MRFLRGNARKHRADGAVGIADAGLHPHRALSLQRFRKLGSIAKVKGLLELMILRLRREQREALRIGELIEDLFER